MSEPTEDTQVKVAANAAEDFVKTFYPTLSRKKGNIASFYIKPTIANPVKPTITINGNVVADPEAVQAAIDEHEERPKYDVQSYDCQVLNSNYNVGAGDSNLGPDKDGKKMSILVLCSGSVRYPVEDEDAPRGFTESIVLVPNWESHGPQAAKGLKKWLIASQTFRTVF
ncbi:hypothetical protein QTJ16_000814 [Diplocarpon rosae]|uniref:NTF2 domain-containing protein n=1 Tax=Diplocarpon rosae TaxID=946125 RepID=A0AAD9T7C5_9HELO|nr:hypothetical protein QTJ16_000814 [Diplocarpon rosae]